MAEVYEKLLAVDGLKMSDYATCNITYRMSGAYRRLLQFPEDFEWSTMNYNDPNEEVVPTELTALRNPKLLPNNNRKNRVNTAASSADTKNESDTSIAKATINDIKDDSSNETAIIRPPVSEMAVGVKRKKSGDYLAVQLKFSLPPGTYATMLLRELTKESTETLFQASLTSQSRSLHDSKDTTKVDSNNSDLEAVKKDS